MPKVSICIPTYNTARYLPEAVESVLNQEFGDYELVIADNASTDGTQDLCRQYTDARVRYLRFEELLNQSGNWNRALGHLDGEYVALLHADDRYLPGFLTDRVRRLDDQPEAGFVFGAVHVIDAGGQPLQVSGRWPHDRVFDVRSRELLEALLHGCIVCPPSLMVRQTCLEQAGHFRSDLTWGHDWEWTIRLAEQAGACYAAEPLAAYRTHDGSGTAEVLNAAKNGSQERLILSDVLSRLSTCDLSYDALRKPVFRALGLRHMYYAEQAVLDGRRSTTRNNLRYAAWAYPGMTLRPTFWALLLGSIISPRWYAVLRSKRTGSPNAIAGQLATVERRNLHPLP